MRTTLALVTVLGALAYQRLPADGDGSQLPGALDPTSPDRPMIDLHCDPAWFTAGAP